MTGPRVVVPEKQGVLDHRSGRTMNWRVQVLHIIMDAVHIFLMKDIKNLQPTVGYHVLKNTHELCNVVW
jgi:hypothetical protein